MPYANAIERRVYARCYRRHRLKTDPAFRATTKAIRDRTRPNRRVNSKKWRLNNPAKHCATQARRRARKATRPIGDTAAILKIYERCRELRRWFNVVVDHIIPLGRNGLHEASNLQIIYASENLLKGDRLNYTPRVVFQ